MFNHQCSRSWHGVNGPGHRRLHAAMPPKPHPGHKRNPSKYAAASKKTQIVRASRMRKPSCFSIGSTAKHAEQVQNRDDEEEAVEQDRDTHDGQANLAHLDGVWQRKPVEL